MRDRIRCRRIRRAYRRIAKLEPKLKTPAAVHAAGQLRAAHASDTIDLLDKVAKFCHVPRKQRRQYRRRLINGGRTADARR